MRTDSPPRPGTEGSRIPAHAGIAIACLVAIWSAGLAWAQQQVQQTPMEVTSDTQEYCRKLADRVHALVRVAPGKEPQEVSVLSVEGEKMCDHGQTRGGIMRLRQAILIMQHEEETAAQH